MRQASRCQLRAPHWQLHACDLRCEGARKPFIYRRNGVGCNTSPVPHLTRVAPKRQIGALRGQCFRATICGCSTSASSFCLRSCVVRTVLARWCPGSAPEAPRRRSEVDRISACGCATCGSVLVFCVLTPAFSCRPCCARGQGALRANPFNPCLALAAGRATISP